MKIKLNKKELSLGHGVTVDVEPANVRDYQKLMGYFGNFSGTQDNPEKLIEKLNQEELNELIVDILPKYASNLKGIELETNEGNRDAEIKDLTEHGVFLNMCVEILSNIVNSSTISEEEEKQVKKL